MSESTFPLLGRQREQSQLESITAASALLPSGVIVVGQSGIGKTRLLREAATSAERSGAIVLWGTCLDIGDAWPLHPLREAAGRLEDESHAGIARRLQAALDHDDAAIGRPDALAVLHRELSAIARVHRVVVILDDLQWMDSSTRRLVRTVLSGLTSAPIAVVGGYRTSYPLQSGPDSFLTEIHRSPLVNVIELSPLDEQVTIELARSLVGRPFSSPEGARLWKRSGGIPLLIRELITHSRPGDAVPTGVRTALEARIASMSLLATEVTRVVSLGIGPVSQLTLGTVTGADEVKVLSAAREAVDAGILTASSKGYAPVHDLFRETALARIPEPERASLHRRMAQAIESGSTEDGPEPIELAHHWAGAGDRRRALPSFLEAARSAGRLGALLESWRHWKVATELLTDAPDWPDAGGLLLEAADAAHAAEDHQSALHLVDSAERLVRSELTERPDAASRSATLDEVRMARSRHLASAGRWDEAERLAAEIFDDAGVDVDLSVDAGAQSAELLARVGRYNEAVSRAASTIERAHGATAAGASVLLASAAMGYSKACLGEPEAGRTILLDALERATESGQLELVEAASRHCADLLMGPLNELEAGVNLAVDQARYLVEEGADPRFTSALLGSATTGLFRLGRWADARRAATATLESDPTGAGVVDLLLGRARVTMGLGDFTSAESDLDVASGLLEPEPSQRYQMPLTTLRAGLAMWRDDPVAARHEIHSTIALIDLDSDYDPWLLAPLVWHGLRAEAIGAGAREDADEDKARALLDMMLSICQRPQVKQADEARLFNAYRLLCLGEFGRVRHESDPEVWEQAAEAWDHCGHPYPAAYARLQEAEALLSEQTRSRRAKNVLLAAHKTTVALGARPLQAQIENLARRARIKLQQDPTPTDEPTAHRQDPLSKLTSREAEVMAELSSGLSNREIGDRLFISGRTVGVHVSNILAKLQVRTRVGAAAIYNDQIANNETLTAESGTHN